MRHYVITRLAIPFSHQNDNHLSDGWLEHRCDLMSRSLTPSLQSQDDQEFAWLLVVDSRLEDKIETMISASEGLGILTPLDPGSKLSDAIDIYGDCITTRVDSDDALAVDFIRRTKQTIRPNSILNFDHGILYDAQRGEAVEELHPSNPFLSFRSDDGRTVYDLGKHNDLPPSIEKINSFTQQPMWLRVIHDSNMTSSWKTGMKRVSISLEERFGYHG